MIRRVHQSEKIKNRCSEIMFSNRIRFLFDATAAFSTFESSSSAKTQSPECNGHLNSVKQLGTLDLSVKSTLEQRARNKKLPTYSLEFFRKK